MVGKRFAKHTQARARIRYMGELFAYKYGDRTHDVKFAYGTRKIPNPVVGVLSKVAAVAQNHSPSSGWKNIYEIGAFQRAAR